MKTRTPPPFRPPTAARPRMPGMACRSRREFVLSLGASLGMLWIVPLRADQARTNPADGRSTEEHPRLRDGLRLVREGDRFLVHDRRNADMATHAVNDLGAEIMRRLDGRTPIRSIAATLAAARNASADEAQEAGLARFVAHLGAADLLVRPFRVYIVERYPEA